MEWIFEIFSKLKINDKKTRYATFLSIHCENLLKYTHTINKNVISNEWPLQQGWEYGWGRDKWNSKDRWLHKIVLKTSNGSTFGHSSSIFFYYQFINYIWIHCKHCHFDLQYWILLIKQWTDNKTLQTSSFHLEIMKLFKYVCPSYVKFEIKHQKYLKMKEKTKQTIFNVN